MTFLTNYRGQSQVYQVLQQLSISYEYYEHQAAHTAEDARLCFRGNEATFCKNLFFRNHKGNRHYLVVLEATRELHIHDLEKRLKQGKLSFASPERMQRYLGLTPGSVSPFGLINDTDNHVYAFFDESLRNAKKLSFHPNLNTASLVLESTDFIRYMDYIGNSYEFLNLYDN